MKFKKGHPNYNKPKLEVTEDMLKEAYKLGALGLTFKEIAEFWGIGTSTLYRYLEKNKELRNKIDKGRMEADITVIKALLREARKGNMTGIIFWLKNRQPDKFRDKREVDLNVVKFSKEERDERMRSIRNIIQTARISEN